MIPVGYMAKRVAAGPDWIKTRRVDDVYSVSGCVSKAFADYINFWEHNAYWFFDSPALIQKVARQHSIDLDGTHLFYYEVHDLQFDDTRSEWGAFERDPSFNTAVVVPAVKTLEGYDVVTFSVGTSAECSPLSCNALASQVQTNQHCLLSTFEQARELLEEGKFRHSEPGPFRIFAVYSTQWP